MMKKIAVFMMGIFALSGTLSLTSAAGGTNGSFSSNTSTNTPSYGFGINAGNSSGIGIAGAGQDTGDSLITIIKNAINWVLSILGLITFVLLLWGGFQMVTSAGDDKKFDEGMKILKNSGLGLAFIALSWMMVNIIFWLITTVGAGAGA